LNEVAVARIAGLDALQRRLLPTRDPDEQRVAVRAIEPKTQRGGGARMTGNAYWGEYVGLDGCERRFKGGASRTTPTAATAAAGTGAARHEKRRNPYRRNPKNGPDSLQSDGHSRPRVNEWS
jgi:hypothetical protein